VPLLSSAFLRLVFFAVLPLFPSSFVLSSVVFPFFFLMTAIESTRLSNRSYKISRTTCALAQRGEFGLPKEGNRGGKSPMREERRSERKWAE
jgi:hypothetical protein